MVKMESSTARARSRLYRIATKQAVKKKDWLLVRNCSGIGNLPLHDICYMVSQSDPPMNLYY